MKQYFFAGLVLLLPLTLTVYVFWYLIDLFTTPFLNTVLHRIQDLYPGLSKNTIVFLSRFIILLLLIVFTFVLGVIIRWFFFRSLLSITQKILYKIPIVKGVYRVSKDIISAFFSEKREKVFQYPVVVPFPSEKSFVVSFLTGKVPDCCQNKVPEKLVSVFVPTAPHPISGYLVILPEKLVKKVAMTNEEAVKFTVSCGLVTPESFLTPPKESL